MELLGHTQDGSEVWMDTSTKESYVHDANDVGPTQDETDGIDWADV